MTSTTVAEACCKTAPPGPRRHVMRQAEGPWRTDPADLVLYGPVAADAGGQVDRGGLAGVQAGDDERRDGGPDLLPDPAPAFPDPDGAGDVPLGQGYLPGVREPPGDVRGGGPDLDGAALAPPVPFLLRHVLHGDRFPVQGVDLVPWCRGALPDREDVVRQQFPAGEPGAGFHGVACAGGDDVPGQAVVPVQLPQQRRELGVE